MLFETLYSNKQPEAPKRPRGGSGGNGCTTISLLAFLASTTPSAAAAVAAVLQGYRDPLPWMYAPVECHGGHGTTATYTNIKMNATYNRALISNGLLQRRLWTSQQCSRFWQLWTPNICTLRWLREPNPWRGLEATTILSKGETRRFSSMVCIRE